LRDSSLAHFLRSPSPRWAHLRDSLLAPFLRSPSPR
jgi:hypothetical protein